MVTGASGGIGKVFAEALAADGWQLTLVARSADKIEALAKTLPGGGHRAVTADLSDPEAIRRVAGDLAGGNYRLLVNNAGGGAYGPFHEASLDTLQRMTRVNCDAVMALAHAFLQRARHGDALINVASALGVLGFPTSTAYAATKAFVVGFSESLWFEQRSRGVYVMALCPGVTRTGFHLAAGGSPDAPPPEAIAQSPEQVVAETLKALRARSKPTVISGWKNRLMVASTRLMTRKARITMMGGWGYKKV